LVVLLAVGWFALARVTLLMSGLERTEASLTSAERLLNTHRQNVQTVLRHDCQILSEDPRLKSTLSTPDIDEPTIVDILKDLSALSGKKLLAVLSPNARVRAVLGAEQFRGLDLSTSSVVKAAQSSEEAVAGAWVVGDKLYDVGAAALRVGDRVIAYLVLGEAVDKKLFDHVYEVTNVGVGLVIDNRVTLSVPEVLEYKAAAEMVAPNPSAFTLSKQIDAGDERFQARALSVEGASLPTWVALVRPSRPPNEHERLLNLLVWGPLLGAVCLACWSVWRFLNR
jgi:hypothetical protein